MAATGKFGLDSEGVEGHWRRLRRSDADDDEENGEGCHW